MTAQVAEKEIESDTFTQKRWGEDALKAAEARLTSSKLPRSPGGDHRSP